MLRDRARRHEDTMTPFPSLDQLYPDCLEVIHLDKRCLIISAVLTDCAFLTHLRTVLVERQTSLLCDKFY